MPSVMGPKGPPIGWRGATDEDDRSTARFEPCAIHPPCDSLKPVRSNDLTLQRPAGPCTQLILLFHGYGARPQAMAPLGEHLAEAFPNAFMVSVAAPNRSDLHPGFEWFTVAGVTEDNRIERVQMAMAAFRAAVEHWQRESGVTAHGTCLIGFSQGAIMALASTQDVLPGPELAGRVVSLSGRFASLPQRVPPTTTVHMIHGKQDEVIRYGFTVQAAEHWIAKGADVTADVLPFVGHAVTDEVAGLVVERLTTYIPKRLWDEALAAARVAR